MVSILETKKSVERILVGIPGVIGVGLSEDGIRSQSGAIRIYISELNNELLGKIPKNIGGYRVEIMNIGLVKPIPADQIYEGEFESGTPYRSIAYRPTVGGVSIGRSGSYTAGTLGAVIYDKNTNQKLLISNNHVIAGIDTKQDPIARVGDQILQPAYGDGGNSSDTIGSLKSWIPLDEMNENLVDAAVASISNQNQALPYILADEERNVIVPGYPKSVSSGIAVKKFSRTSDVDAGYVVDWNATISVEYEDKVLIFVDQILMLLETNGGDSGSVVLDENNDVVGLLFAGASTQNANGTYTKYGVANKMGNVYAMLGYDIDSEEISFRPSQTDVKPNWSPQIVSGEVPISENPNIIPIDGELPMSVYLMLFLAGIVMARGISHR